MRWISIWDLEKKESLLNTNWGFGLHFPSFSNVTHFFPIWVNSKLDWRSIHILAFWPKAQAVIHHLMYITLVILFPTSPCPLTWVPGIYGCVFLGSQLALSEGAHLPFPYAHRWLWTTVSSSQIHRILGNEPITSRAFSFSAELISNSSEQSKHWLRQSISWFWLSHLLFISFSYPASQSHNYFWASHMVPQLKHCLK